MMLEINIKIDEGTLTSDNPTVKVLVKGVDSSNTSYQLDAKDWSGSMANRLVQHLLDRYVDPVRAINNTEQWPRNFAFRIDNNIEIKMRHEVGDRAWYCRMDKVVDLNTPPVRLRTIFVEMPDGNPTLDQPSMRFVAKQLFEKIATDIDVDIKSCRLRATLTDGGN